MAAWPSGLGRALQRPVPQFDSGRRLQQNEGPADWPGLLVARPAQFVQGIIGIICCLFPIETELTCTPARTLPMEPTEPPAGQSPVAEGPLEPAHSLSLAVPQCHCLSSLPVRICQ